MHNLDTILQRYTSLTNDTKNLLLGAAFVVCDERGVLYSGATGRTGFDTASDPFSTSTFTWIASMTKIVTTTCLMQLVERGKLSLDQSLSTTAPELAAIQILRGFTKDGTPILEKNTTEITLRMLLTHTCGLAADFLDPATLRWSDAIGRSSRHLDWNIDGFTTPFRFNPGESWLYGSGVDWAGIVLERVTGQRLGEYMEANIFSPLQMKETGFWPAHFENALQRQATWTCRETCRDQQGTLRGQTPFTPEEHELEAGGSGLYSTPHDFSLFLQGFLQGKLVSQATLSEMFRPQLARKPQATLNKHAYHPLTKNVFAPEFPHGMDLNFGLGGVLNLSDVPGKRRAGSMAWSGLVNSRWWVDPKSRLTGVLVVNISPPGDPVVAKLYDELEQEVYASMTELKLLRNRQPGTKL